MEAALKLIITKSQNAAPFAMQVLRAIDANSPMVQTRYNQAVQIALNDPGAYWTEGDRAVLAEHLGAQGSDRSTMLAVRLSSTERQAVEQAADAAGMNISDYVRGKLFG